jgi:hypothetical protein
VRLLVVNSARSGRETTLLLAFASCLSRQRAQQRPTHSASLVHASEHLAIESHKAQGKSKLFSYSLQQRASGGRAERMAATSCGYVAVAHNKRRRVRAPQQPAAAAAAAAGSPSC